MPWGLLAEQSQGLAISWTIGIDTIVELIIGVLTVIGAYWRVRNRLDLNEARSGNIEKSLATLDRSVATNHKQNRNSIHQLRSTVNRMNSRVAVAQVTTNSSLNEINAKLTHLDECVDGIKKDASDNIRETREQTERSLERIWDDQQRQDREIESKVSHHRDVHPT
jgi:hypothetical protein